MSQFCGSAPVFINRCCVTSAADACSARAAAPIDDNAASSFLLDMSSLPILGRARIPANRSARGLGDRDYRHDPIAQPYWRENTSPTVVPGRGRDASYLAPPAQNRTCGFPAYGSHLGCVTAKRWLGQGWRTRGWGSQSAASCLIRAQVSAPFWLRRPSDRCQPLVISARKATSALKFVGTAW